MFRRATKIRKIIEHIGRDAPSDIYFRQATSVKGSSFKAPNPKYAIENLKLRLGAGARMGTQALALLNSCTAVPGRRGCSCGC